MHTTVTPRLVIAIVDQGAAALARAAKVIVPTLFLVTGDDKIMCPDVTCAFARKKMKAGISRRYWSWRSVSPEGSLRANGQTVTIPANLGPA
jgi:hypothetical protein